MNIRNIILAFWIFLIGSSLDAQQKIKEVVVKSKKEFSTKKLDKTIIHPDALISNAGTTALDVLEKSPGVAIDMNGGISMHGKQGVNILVDERPLNLPAAELSNYLKTIASSTIESIELMTNPSSKYDAEGNAGIINIRLKKNNSYGFTGSLNTSYGKGRHMRSNNSANLSYRVNKVNLFANMSLNQNNMYQDLTIHRRYLTAAGNLSSVFEQNSLLAPESGSQSVKLGMDYSLNEKSSLGVVLSAMRNPFSQSLQNNATILDSLSTLTNYIQATNPTEKLLKNIGVNLNWIQKLSNQHGELKLNIDYILYDASMSQRLSNTILAPDHSPLSSSVLESNLPSTIDIKSAKLDYTNELSKIGKLELGLKSSFVSTSNIAEFYDEIGTNRSFNMQFSNNFNYQENINAAYLNFSRDIMNWSIQCGLRFENSNISGLQYGNSLVTDSSFVLHYGNLFPTLYVQYRLDTMSRHQLIFSYGRRIDRPNYKDLNPFTYPLDRYTYYGGNPFLQPTFSDNFQLSHVYQNMLTTTLEYSIGRNIIFETNEQRGNIFYSRPGNFATQISYGVSIEGGLPISKWWTLQLYTGLFNNVFRSQVYTETLDNSKFYYVLVPTNIFKISNSLSAELAGNYQSEFLTGQFFIDPIWNIRAGISKKLWQDRLTLKFNASDIFFTNQIRGQIRNIANATAGWYSVMDSRVFSFSASYRFSKGKIQRPRESGGAESERNRVKL